MPEDKAASMIEFIRKLIEEVEVLASIADKREYVIERCLDLFDEYFVPIDLPGPDGVIDPLIRAAIEPIVGRIYDEIIKKLKG